MSTEAIKDALLEAAGKLAVLRGAQRKFDEVCREADATVKEAEAVFNAVRAETRATIDAADTEVKVAEADLIAYQEDVYQKLGISVDVLGSKSGGQVSL